MVLYLIHDGLLILFKCRVVQLRIQSCRQILGNIATCARPRLYFKNGIWGPTTCAWEDVKSLNCSQTMNDAEKAKLVFLPDAEDAYSRMSNLEHIDVSYSDRLKNLPFGLSYVPPPSNHNQTNLSIHAAHCPQLRSIPYALCQRPLRSLVLGENTAVGKVLNWSGQVSGGTLQLNSACENAWNTTLQKIYLANNNLSCWQGTYKKPVSFYDPAWAARSCSFDDISKLKNLALVDLSGNNISRVTDYMVTIIGNVPMRKRNSSLENGVVFTGNPIKSLTIHALDGALTAEWLRAIEPASADLTKLNIRACQIKDEGIVALSQVLGKSKVRMLALDGIFLGEVGIAALVPSIISMSQTLENLYMGSVMMRTAGLELLLQTSKIHEAKWRVLHLEANILNGSGRVISNYIETNDSLEYLSLSNSRLGEQDNELIAMSLPNAENLRHLKIGWGRWSNGDKLLKLLAISLPISALQKLEIQCGGNYTEESLTAFANVLNKTNLTDLRLSVHSQYFSFFGNRTNAHNVQIEFANSQCSRAVTWSSNSYYEGRYHDWEHVVNFDEKTCRCES